MHSSALDLDPREIEFRDEYLPEEVVRFSISQAFLRSICSGAVMTSLLAGFIFGGFLAINVLAFVGGNKPNLQDLPLTALFFLGFTLCFVGSVGLPVAFVQSWRWRPRRIRAVGGEILVETRAKEIRFPLEQCQWRVSGRIAFDRSGAYFARSPLLILSLRQSGLKDGQEPLAIACGFSKEHFDAWYEYLSGHDVHRLNPGTFLDRAFRILLCSSTGVILGVALGRIIDAAFGMPHAVLGLGLLGLLDGAVFGVGWNILRYWEHRDSMAYLRTYGGAVVATSFALLGLKVGFVGGLRFGIGSAVANAMFGYLAFRRFHVLASGRNAAEELIDDSAA